MIATHSIPIIDTPPQDINFGLLVCCTQTLSSRNQIHYGSLYAETTQDHGSKRHNGVRHDGVAAVAALFPQACVYASVQRASSCCNYIFSHFLEMCALSRIRSGLRRLVYSAFRVVKYSRVIACSPLRARYWHRRRHSSAVESIRMV